MRKLYRPYHCRFLFLSCAFNCEIYFETFMVAMTTILYRGCHGNHIGSEKFSTVLGLLISNGGTISFLYNVDSIVTYCFQ